MQITFDVDIKLVSTDKLLKGLGLEESGKVQHFFSNDLMRRSDKRVPMDTKVLANSAKLTPQGDGIIYITPYAQYHWFGKLMVDPITGKGAFYDPLSGRFWSRPNTQKELTDIDLNYQGAPMRGSEWVDRTFIEEGKEIIQSTELYIEKVSELK